MPQVVEVVGYGKVEFPDGMSREAMAEALKSLPPKPEASAAAPAAPARPRVEVSDQDLRRKAMMSGILPSVFPAPPQPGEPEPISRRIGATVGSLATGMAQPVAGALQLAGINKPAQMLQEISEGFKQIGGKPASVAEFAGEVASPLSMKAGKVGEQLVSRVPGLGKSVMARMGGAGAGAAALTPTAPTESYTDFLSEKAKQIGVGGAGGAALGKATQAVMSPQVSQQMQMLKDMGMKYFTPGQLMSDIPLLGRGIQATEKALTSLPITGSMIRRGLETSQEDFTQAIANRVLAPMGEKVPKNIPPGEEMINYVNQRVNDAYDTIVPKLKLDNARYKDPTSPTGFTTTVKAFNEKISDLIKGLTSSSQKNNAQTVREEFDQLILTPLLQKGGMTGQEFREAEKALGQKAFSYMRDPNLFDVGNVLKNLQAELRQELINQNPKFAKELQGIHLTFRRAQPFNQAAGYLGAEGRIFSPQQLESAIKAKSVSPKQFASGQSLLYPEAQAGIGVMGRPLPSSGTPERLMTANQLKTGLGLGEAAAAMAEPSVLIPLAVSSMLYNKPAMGVLTKMATERPQFMRQMAPAAATTGAVAGGIGSVQPNAPRQVSP